MGILTNLVDNLEDELLNFGFNQIDAYVTREIQEGRDENAFNALDKWENQLVQNYGLASKVQSGSFNMPGADLVGSRGVLPTSPEGQVYMDAFSNIPPVPPEIAKSNAAFQIFNQRYSDALQNNPATLQREIQQKAQENRMGLVKDLASQGYTQNQMGFQEALGAYDQPSTYDLPREERNRRSQERQFGMSQAQWEAGEPYKVEASKRALFNKQQPGYGAGADAGGPVNAITLDAYNKSRQLIANKYPHLSQTVMDENLKKIKVPNARGDRVAEIFVDLKSRTKKPNDPQLMGKSVQLEAKEFNALPLERRMEIMGRPRLGAGMQTQPDAGKLSGEQKQARERGASIPVPQESIYNRTVAPQAQPGQAQPTQQPPTPQTQPQNQSALSSQQINTIDAQVRNADPVTRERFRQKLKARGIDPSLIPSLR